jgi:uncharacterized membrane protein YhfC
MAGSVSVLTIICIVIACITGFAIPVVLFVYFWKKKKAEALPFLVGCAVMLLFAFVLEAFVHRIVLFSPVGEKIKANVFLYAAYGAGMAALFEETGRLTAFLTVLKRKRGRNINALMYGAGHGGFEAAAILGMAMINNLVMSFMINAGQTDALTGKLSGDALTKVNAAIKALITTPSWIFLLGGVERMFAVIIQISLSVIVWFAAKQEGKKILFLLALLLHFVVDAVAVIMSGFHVHAALIEVAVGVLALLVALIARHIWTISVREEEGRINI